MVKIKISKHIYRDCEQHELGCWIRKSMKLPYAPYPGLLIHDGKGEIFEIVLVKYDHGEKMTYCYINPEHHENYEYAKKHAHEWGWEIREVPAGNFCQDLKSLF